MRKVTAGLFSTIDGVVEAPDQWQTAFDDEMGAALSRMLEEQDAVLLGRVTFSEWAATGRRRPTSRSRAGSTARRSTSRRARSTPSTTGRTAR